MTFLRIVIPLYLLFEHDLFGKPVPTFPDHALAIAIDRTAPVRDYTFSNGTLIAVLRSSHAGTGRFLERMNSGLNSFD
jgi:hypothetical protein